MNKAMRRDILLLLQEAASVLEGTFGKEDGLASELRDMHRQMLAVEPYTTSPMSKARVEALNKMSRSEASKKVRAAERPKAASDARWGRTPEERAERIAAARRMATEQRRGGGGNFGRKEK